MTHKRRYHTNYWPIRNNFISTVSAVVDVYEKEDGDGYESSDTVLNHAHFRFIEECNSNLLVYDICMYTTLRYSKRIFYYILYSFNA
jgi:hypothetical protein